MLKAPENISVMVLQLIGGISFMLISYVVYNIFLHPLRQYPGPWYTRGSRLWFILKVFKGTVVYDIKRLHETYGDVVRIAPNELSYTNPDAWQEIYGRNDRSITPDTKDVMVFKKDPVFYSGVLAETKFFADVDGEPYKRQKKGLLGGLTRKANLLHEDEVLIGNLNEFIEALKPNVGKSSFNILPYVQNLAMDIMLRLIVGHDLQALQSGGSPHSTVTKTDRAFHLSIVYLQFRRLSSLIADPIENLVGKMSLRYGMFDYMDFITPFVNKRLEDKSPGPDAVSYMLPYMSTEEVNKGAIMLTLAGSDSSVSVLSSAIYFMLDRPETMLKARKEVRDMFKDRKDINISSTESLTYIQACITEATRLFPPFWGAAPREVPATGAIICGKYVPPKSTVSIYHWAMYQTESNFQDAKRFKPERWIGDKNEIEAKSYNPFSFGPRTCVGKETSLLLTRVIMAYLIFEYDLELGSASKNTGWERPSAYMAPARNPLYVKLNLRSK